MSAPAGLTGRVARDVLDVRPALRLLVRIYRRFISPTLPRACRFEPSCAAYAEEALQSHGTWKALRLIAGRLLRCHPFHPGGYDPVP